VKSETSAHSRDAEATQTPTRSPVPLVVAILFSLVAVFFVATAIIGATRWMHPVPYWDMWDGYLSFWFELQDGNTAI